MQAVSTSCAWLPCDAHGLACLVLHGNSNSEVAFSSACTCIPSLFADHQSLFSHGLSSKDGFSRGLAWNSKWREYHFEKQLATCYSMDSSRRCAKGSKHTAAVGFRRKSETGAN